MLAAPLHGAIVHVNAQEETLFPPARRGLRSEDWLLSVKVLLA